MLGILKGGLLKSGVKKEALKNLEGKQKSYLVFCAEVEGKAEKLFMLRHSSSMELIPKVEEYVNNLANISKEFNKSFSEYKFEWRIFNDVLSDLNDAVTEANMKAAMAVATTFGMAAAGEAISTLSGATASKATLALLGGGILIQGGVAGGTTLLALAGPLGLAIGGVAAVSGGIYARNNNEKIAGEATQAAKEIEINIRKILAVNFEIQDIIAPTEKHIASMKRLLSSLETNAPNDYLQFDDEMRGRLDSLIGHVNSLSELLNQRVNLIRL